MIGRKKNRQIENMKVDLDEFLKEMERGWKDVHEKTNEFLLEEIRKNASGRPGPDVVTGVYRDSWGISGDMVTTRHPAALRLEFGYVGVDSLGRDYNQPPFPHVRPALEAAQKFRAEAMEKSDKEIGQRYGFET